MTSFIRCAHRPEIPEAWHVVRDNHPNTGCVGVCAHCLAGHARVAQKQVSHLVMPRSTAHVSSSGPFACFALNVLATERRRQSRSWTPTARLAAKAAARRL